MGLLAAFCAMCKAHTDGTSVKLSERINLQPSRHFWHFFNLPPAPAAPYQMFCAISYRLWSYKLKLWCSDDIYVTVQVYGVKNFQFFKQIMKISYFTLTNYTPVVAYLSQMVCAAIVLRVSQLSLEPSPIQLPHHSILWWKDCNHDIVRYHACESSGLLDRLPWRGQGIHVQQRRFKYETSW